MTSFTQRPEPYSTPRPRIVWGGGADADKSQSLRTSAEAGAGAAASTCDAVLYALRCGGEAALARQGLRLAEMSVRQLQTLIASLKRLGASETLLLALAERYAPAELLAAGNPTSFDSGRERRRPEQVAGKVQRAFEDCKRGNGNEERPPFAISEWLDPALLPPRCWLYGRHYIRGSVSCTVANGGTGKTSLLIAEGIALATGRNLLGIPVSERRRVLYWNGEEPLEEIRRRVYATCQHYVVPCAELSGWLFIASGLERPIRLNSQTDEALDELKCFIRDQAIEVVIIDPFVASHSCAENDNTAIDAVAKQWAALANEKQISVALAHHTRKPASGQTSSNTVHDSRGATALIDAARTVRVLNIMTDGEAVRAKVEHPNSYVRISAGKANYAPAETATWMHIITIVLPNNDEVGAVIPWKFPGIFDGVTTSHMEQVRDKARNGEYRADPRSDDWIGIAVADVLQLDIQDDSKRIKDLLKIWYANGVLRKVDRKDASRRTRKFVELGGFNEGCSSP